MNNDSIRIVFMGTPEFAVAPLQAIKDSGINIVGVVTAPDQPAGRGKKIKSPAIREYAEANLSCPIFQPEKLKDPAFVSALQKLQADLFIVVAFRMLPEIIWSMPAQGTINLHASLLPQYRGAAPINWVIINGEHETGLTTFLINKEIDTGRILLQEKMQIQPGETAGSLHDRMMVTGSELLVRTIRQFMRDTIQPVPQESFNIPEGKLKKAPKIFKEDCRINWNSESRAIDNLVRGLHPFPGAFTHLVEQDGTSSILKIHSTASTKTDEQEMPPGTLMKVEDSGLWVKTGDGWLELDVVQAAGKNKMHAADFLRGFRGNIQTCILQ